MVRWQQQISDQCPQCRQPREDKPHIIQCHQEMVMEKWNVLKQFKEWMQTEQSDPHLIELLIAELHVWHNSELHTHTPLVAQKQLEIGWDVDSRWLA